MPKKMRCMAKAAVAVVCPKSCGSVRVDCRKSLKQSKPWKKKLDLKQKASVQNTNRRKKPTLTNEAVAGVPPRLLLKNQTPKPSVTSPIQIHGSCQPVAVETLSRVTTARQP